LVFLSIKKAVNGIKQIIPLYYFYIYFLKPESFGRKTYGKNMWRED